MRRLREQPRMVVARALGVAALLGAGVLAGLALGDGGDEGSAELEAAERRAALARLRVERTKDELENARRELAVATRRIDAVDARARRLERRSARLSRELTRARRAAARARAGQ